MNLVSNRFRNTREEAENKIIKAGRNLLFKLAPGLKKAGLYTKDLMKSIAPELNLSAMGQELSLNLTATDGLTSIDELLVGLNLYAKKLGKHALFVFDEFQQISEIDGEAFILYQCAVCDIMEAKTPLQVAARC